MSFLPQPSKQTVYPGQYPVDIPGENGLGLAGFIVSMAGLVLCGIPSIIGVLLSLLGLRKSPKGFATAGLIIGMLGLLELGLAIFVSINVYKVGQRAGGFIQSIPVYVRLNQEAQIVVDEWNSLDRIPTKQEGDELLKGKRDSMGNPMVYETDGESFSIRTAGPDGTLQTKDDITVGPFSDPQVVIPEFEADSELNDPDSFQDIFDKLEIESK